MIYNWLSNNWIEIFGAIAGIVYVFLEIRQNYLLWPVGIVTSAVYIWVFFTGKLYADMSLQGYYLAISFAGWYWWMKGSGHGAQGLGRGAEGVGHGAKGMEQRAQENDGDNKGLRVTRINYKTGVIVFLVFVILLTVIWFVLSRFTDSQVPFWDSFITSLSIVATWMLARKILEQWYLWVVVNSVSIVLFIVKGLYPTVILYFIYLVMSFIGLREWRRSI